MLNHIMTLYNQVPNKGKFQFRISFFLTLALCCCLLKIFSLVHFLENAVKLGKMDNAALFRTVHLKGMVLDCTNEKKKDGSGCSLEVKNLV